VLDGDLQVDFGSVQYDLFMLDNLLDNDQSLVDSDFSDV
jgi:hypothetical protein